MELIWDGGRNSLLPLTEFTTMLAQVTKRAVSRTSVKTILPRCLPHLQADTQQRRSLHATRRQENAIVVGSLGVAAAALGGKYLLEAYEGYKANKAASGTDKSSASSSMFNMSYRNFYDGPFEEKMTRREAALILGVRESASADRIRNAHRKLLIANHPDTGGSTFISTKINEAKELLLGGK
ncbi:hypothetical protein H310_10090 [Aphanomyces invadans]|uniref:J domain-containing protein n=1 Tax=Aphanomyces invadans TaxID=157072 RepID=A0A024TT26_9STRA|nr:hypothetical protein H310_10090 [Aphanomyces invadans]ETV96786.1 hypothetical protein H310_10090 [Aphanomyces invadans]RHY22872.1 hypothetical protein DYB32_009376 [Aphanomyces invadans]|eukprot:XP_008874563.1 hypothetical protein H310_10090 [Aphanomyces invadans]